jgi:hypothetical protein
MLSTMIVPILLIKLIGIVIFIVVDGVVLGWLQNILGVTASSRWAMVVFTSAAISSGILLSIIMDWLGGL